MGTLNATGGTFQGWELSWKVTAPGQVMDFFLINNYPSNAIDVTAPSGLANLAYGYFVVTYDGSQTAAGVKIYANASLLTNTVNVNSLSLTAANGLPVKFNVRNDNSQPYGRAMAFAEVYNCVLTPTQISTYNAAGPGIY